jgi:hypothetical protein
MLLVVLALSAIDPEAKPWTFGGGLGVTLAELNASGTAPSVTPAVYVGAERFLSGGMWLTFSLNGGYTRTTGTTLSADTTTDANGLTMYTGTFSTTPFGPNDTWSFGGLFGIRELFNPGGVVEVSLRLALAGDLRRTSAQPAKTTDTTGGVALLASIVLERMLVDSLALRLTTDIVQAGWSHASFNSLVASGGGLGGLGAAQAFRTLDTFTIGLVLRPVLELRYYF